jgi:uncharacterized SAM-binding protein YcdF (DUF218 family)
LRLGFSLAAAVVAVLAWAALARTLAPASNTALNRFDAIIVLGSPADSDGNPKDTQQARVTEAVNEYKRGVASHIILTGGAVSNRFVEARVMARSAQAQGIPESALLEDTQARDTVENACYSLRIMKDHGWRSAEIVSSAYQLPRAGLIFNSLPLQWSAHEAPPISPQSPAYDKALASVEVLKTARYLIWSRWAERCEP